MNVIMIMLPIIIAVLSIIVTVLVVYWIWKIKQNSDQILQLLQEKRQQ